MFHQLGFWVDIKNRQKRREIAPQNTNTPTPNPLQIDRNLPQIHPKSTPNRQRIHPKLPLHIFIFFFNFSVFDVMLHTVSPPRAEGASPPSPPQLHSQNAVTLTKCSYTHKMQLHLNFLQLHSKSRDTRGCDQTRGWMRQRLVAGCPEGSIHRPKLG
jgi:hypothetical protein